MKNLFSRMTFAVIFLGFAITGVQANQVKKSKSNVSNNKTNSTKGEVCDDGNSNDADCVKANKDYATDPYVETTQRDRASGQATGKRQHKPVTVTTEAATSTPSSNDGAASSSSLSSSSSAPAGTASEGCCPGRCCPPEQTGTGAATSSVTSASPGTGDASSGGDPAPQLKPGSDPFKGTNIAKLKQQKEKTAAKTSGTGDDGCCPGRCCPPDAQDHAINTKGTGTTGIAEEQSAAKPTYDLKAAKK